MTDKFKNETLKKLKKKISKYLAIVRKCKICLCETPDRPTF